MMESVTCERCGATGKRHLGHCSPEGWYFGAFTFDETGDHDSGDRLIVHACSAECRDALWTMQSGHRWNEIERRIDVPAELRRAALNEATKLRERARSIRECVYPTGDDSNEAAGILFAKLLDTQAGELIDAAENLIDGIRDEQAGGPKV